MKIMKTLGLVFLVIVLMVISFVVGVGLTAKFILSPVGGKEAVKIEVKKGESSGSVAHRLEKTGVIRSSPLFRIILKLTDKENKIKPGIYYFNPNQTMLEIVYQLEKGSDNIHVRLVTIPEGLTLKQIAELLEQKEIIPSQNFLTAVKEKKFMIQGKEIPNLEGYLLPETYDFPPSFKAEDIIKRMLKQFEETALVEYNENRDQIPVKLSLYQVLTLASMVEREAQIPEERPKIAAVYYNRMKKKMKMECDATIQYALGKQKEVLLYSDLEIDSPYNTYKHEGLPPTPIANPGIASIKAVMHPADVDYLYYVRNDIKNDGSHAFATSFQGHQENINKYQK